MKQLLLRNSLSLLTALAICVAIYVAVNWGAMPFLQRIVGLFFVAIIVHVWEESRFPGGFAQVVTSRLNFAIADPQFAELILAAAILYLGFVPLQSLGCERSDFRAPLANAARKHHGIQSAHRRNVSADVFPDAIAVGLQCQQRSRLLFRGGLEDFPHVTRRSG